MQKPTPPSSSAYANYVLFLMLLAYVFNFLDRQIVAILATDIKRDLEITDAELGFLIGTAFAVFYALFGIPLGRLADMWQRGRLMAWGLALWSAMTVLSGLAGNFTQLALARMGVGIGEASASPCAYSLLSDYFSRSRRGTVLAIYTSGIFLGMGLSLIIGGQVVAAWDAAYNATTAPWGLKGWQVAFFVVGLPGLILALFIRMIREPQRGQADGLPPPPREPHPFRKTGQELASVLPPLTLFHLWKIGAGAKVIVANLVMATATILSVWFLILMLGNARQWVALGIAIYAVFSWAQALKLRDPPAFAMIFATPVVVYSVVAFGLMSLFGYGVSAFLPAYAETVLGQEKTVVGNRIGLAIAFAGWAGITLGGYLSDLWRSHDVAGRLYLCMLAMLLPLPILLVMFTTINANLFFWAAAPFFFFSTLYLGAAASTLQDLVLPRMRGTITATYFLGTTIIGLGIGPYAAGKISDITGSLRYGILSLAIVAPFVLLLLAMAARRLGTAESSLVARARAAGERL